jgi:ryanodine receptor 2
LSYAPQPIDISRVQLPQALADLTERLAEHAHDVWAAQRLRDGWTYGPRRDDAAKSHPCLVPYDQLPDSEKQYDRNAVEGTLRAVLALGYRIEGPA